MTIRPRSSTAPSGVAARVVARVAARVRRDVVATSRSLKHRNFRLFWTGQLVSLVGTWMADVALAWLVLDLTGSPVRLGLAMTMRFGPTLVLSLFGGLLADRLPKRSLLVATQSVLMVQAFALAALTSAGAITMSLVYALALVRGVAEAVDIPTRQAFVVEMVGPADVQNAVALNSSQFNVARILGPAVGGVLVSTVGVAVCFWLNAVSFVPVLAAFALLRSADLHPGPRSARAGVVRLLGDGFRYAARTPDVALILGMVAFIGAFGYNFTVMLPLLARYAYGSGPEGLGALTAAMGAGSLCAAVFVASRGRPTRRMVLVGAGGFSVVLFLLALAPGQTMALALLVAVGFFGILFHTGANSRLQLIVPGELRGRVMSMYALLFIGTTPLGSLLVGTLAEHQGIRTAVGEVAAVCLVGAGLSFLVALRMRRGVANPLPDLG
ncbi:MAG: MFS transporter [Thermoleophilia bacterium]